jgi:hypothetical protein
MTDGESAARARLEALFTTFDRLTPDELGHIGLTRTDRAERIALLRAVEGAARRADRSVLLGEARTEAADLVMRRYAEGGLHATWVGLNWGLSQGTTGDRVAIVEALADAAAAAVVADLVDREVVESLALDAGHVLGLATGEASDGALAHATEPAAAGFRDTPGRRIAVVVGALVVGVLVFAIGAVMVDPLVGVAGGITVALIEIALARRDPGEPGRPGGRARSADDRVA